MKLFPNKGPWDRRTDPNPCSGSARAHRAGMEAPSQVMDLCDALRALARRVEDEGVNTHTVDTLQSLMDEAGEML